MSATECLLDWPTPLPPFSGWWKPASGTSISTDDIVIFSKDPASHLMRLEAVFQKLKQAKLKLKPLKCELFYNQITYLGHTFSAQEIVTDEEKINVIKRWPTHTTVTEVWSFLGFTGYYCWFIPKFMQIAQPLHEMTSRKNAGKKKAAITLNDRCQQSFNKLKHLWNTATIPAYTNFT